MTHNIDKHNFSESVALITGSSNGIGAAIAVALCSYGCKVVITGRSAVALEKVAQDATKVSGGIAPLRIVGDLLDDTFPSRLITETIAKFGKLDFLVNNAGSMMRRTTLSDTKFLQEFDKLVNLNARCVVNLTQLAVPHLKQSKGAAILNIGSIASQQPWSGIIPYCVSKAMLNSITKTTALELGKYSIRVNIINPGAVDTDIYRSMEMSHQDWTQFMQRKEQTSLLKLVAQPDDIAHLACFLLSQDAKNVTGSIFTSDTGASLK